METTGKTAAELEALILEAVKNVRGCRNVSRFVVGPIYPTDAAKPDWEVQDYRFNGPAGLLPECERASKAAVSRLKTFFHLEADG